MPTASRPADGGTRTNAGRLVCDVCPRGCRLGPDDRGFCFVRQNRDGRIVSTTYGRSTGFCIDPIEKKPLNHFYPGTSVLSFGTAGCNLGCKFCQNWTSTKSREVDRRCDEAAPEAIAEAARRLDCRSVAFTYNDPIVWIEYAIDTARACRAAGVKTVAVTSGYMTPGAAGRVLRADGRGQRRSEGVRRGFLPAALRRPSRTGARHAPLAGPRDRRLARNHQPADPRRKRPARRRSSGCATGSSTSLGPDVPLHFSAFHPDFQMTDRGPTPLATLLTAHEIARRAGLSYVYTGNVVDAEHQSTYCPACGERGDRARRLPPGHRRDRARPLRALRPPDRRPIRRDGRALGAAVASRCGSPTSPRAKPPRETTMDRARTEPGSAREARSDRPARATDLSRRRPARRRGRRAAAAGHERALAGRVGQPADHRRVCEPEAGGPVAELLRLPRPVGRAVRGARSRGDPGGHRRPAIPADLADRAGAPRHGGLAALGHEADGSPGRGSHQGGRDRPARLAGPTRRGPRPLAARRGRRAQPRRRGLPAADVPQGPAAARRLEGRRDAGEDVRGLRDPRAAGRAFSRPSRRSCPSRPPAGPTELETARLADFCRANLLAMVQGATPSFYLPGAFDGNVNGVAVAVTVPALGPNVSSATASRSSRACRCSRRCSSLIQALANRLRARRVDPRDAAGRPRRADHPLGPGDARHGRPARPRRRRYPAAAPSRR